MVATVCLTFDYWQSAYDDAFPIMVNHGDMPGTWFVAPEMIGQTGCPTVYNLAVLQINKWEIGIYSNKNMVNLYNTSRVQAKQWMASQKAQLLSLGFSARTYAPNARAWSAPLTELSRDVFENVRALDPPTGTPLGTWQTYPIPDRNDIQFGGTDSLGPSDTVESLSAQLDSVIAAPQDSIWYVITHKVIDDPNDPYAVKPAVFSGFLDYLAAKRDAGLARVVTVAESMTAA